jgi:hypothetical protein
VSKSAVSITHAACATRESFIVQESIGNLIYGVEMPTMPTTAHRKAQTKEQSWLNIK